MRKGVPRGRNGEIVIAVAIPIVVDIQTIGIEIAKIDAVAIRVQIMHAFIHTTRNRGIQSYCFLYFT